MFENQLVELSSLVKSVIKEDNEMQRKFYKHLESIVDEDDIIDELMAKIETLTQRCDVSEGITIEGILLDGTDGSATDAGSKVLLG